MERDEFGTHMRVQSLRSEIIDPSIALHDGHIVRFAGDGMLVTFSSATAALLCAMQMQHQVCNTSSYVPDDDRIWLRIGINVADILVDGNEIAGVGVNLAARLEPLADPGGICVSLALKEQIADVIGVEYVDAGLRRLKNFSRPVRVFHVVGKRLSTHARIRTSLTRIMRSAFCRQSPDEATAKAAHALFAMGLKRSRAAEMNAQTSQHLQTIVRAGATEARNRSSHVRMAVRSEGSPTMLLRPNDVQTQVQRHSTTAAND